jgi:hypothetical protein
MSSSEFTPSQSLTNSSYEPLILGGVYSALAKESGRGDYILTKVVALTPDLVHVAVLPESFRFRPHLRELENRKLDFSLLCDIDEARSRHLALSRKLFCLMRPIFLCQAPVSTLDRVGYSQWLLMESAEIMHAPDTIASEDNKGVYWRIFLLTGLPFGLFQAIYHYFRHGLWSGLFAFLFGFLLFGAGMVLTQHFAVGKRLGVKGKANLPEHSLSAFQVEEMVLCLPYERAFELCGRAVRIIKNVRILEEDLSGGTLEAEVGFSLASEGERISVCVYPSGAQVGVIVASVPRANGELDLGKNFANVAKVKEFLNSASRVAELSEGRE